MTEQSTDQPTTYLGRTGVEVSRLCLGTMMFGAWGETDHEKSIRVIHRAIDAGITFIDTADIYAYGESEEIVGKAIAQSGRRDDLILATKFFNGMKPEANFRGGSRRWIMRAVEDSLRRLGTDYIDLYQMHRPDEHTDIEETLGALTDLVTQGKIRYIGSSTFQPSQVVEAQWVARERGTARFVTEQPPYSMLTRGIEADLLPTTQRHGMGTLVWSPLAGGWLSGKYRKGQEIPKTHRNDRDPSRYDPADPKFEAATSWAPSPTSSACRSCTSRSRSCCATRRSPARSSARAPWSSSSRSWMPRTWSSTPPRSTGSTRSCRPAST